MCTGAFCCEPLSRILTLPRVCCPPCLQVEVMQKELQELQPVLAATAKEVEDMMVVITNDKKEADETKKQVEEQEKEANEQVRLGTAAQLTVLPT